MASFTCGDSFKKENHHFSVLCERYCGSSSIGLVFIYRKVHGSRLVSANTLNAIGFFSPKWSLSSLIPSNKVVLPFYKRGTQVFNFLASFSSYIAFTNILLIYKSCSVYLFPFVMEKPKKKIRALLENPSSGNSKLKSNSSSNVCVNKVRSSEPPPPS